MDEKAKKEIHKMILEAVDAVLVGIENMGFAKQKDLMKFRVEVQEQIQELKDTQAMNHKELKDDIRSLDNEVAKAATKSEVEAVRRKIN